jgi:hypothetical protein
MRRMRVVQGRWNLYMLAALAVGLAAWLAACGDDDDDAAPPPVERKQETAEELPKLPRGFEPHLSRANGLILGRPPGWKATNRGIATLLIAPDKLVVMSLTADRTDAALAADPRALATDTFQVLEGYKGRLDPSEPRRFKHRYEAYAVKGEGVAADTGVPQRLRLIVLRRKGATIVTAVIAENAKVKAPEEVDQALEALRTLRTRPVG